MTVKRKSQGRERRMQSNFAMTISEHKRGKREGKRRISGLAVGEEGGF